MTEAVDGFGAWDIDAFLWGHWHGDGAVGDDDQSIYRFRGAEIGNIDQRLRALERQLERAGGRSAANAAQAAERVGETIVSALQGMADRLDAIGGTLDVRSTPGSGTAILGTVPAAEAIVTRSGNSNPLMKNFNWYAPLLPLDGSYFIPSL